MKNLSPLLFLGLFLSSFLFCQPLTAQNNEFKGSITLPQLKKKSRLARGSAYRNRTKQKAESEDTKKKTVEDVNQEVVISLQPLNFKAIAEPLENAVIYQVDKSFSPKTLPVTKGTKVYFINKDDFYHNVFSITPKARFNVGRRPSGSRHGVVIKKLGVVKVFCDIHSQMKASIISMDTPYFTTINSDGTYALKNLPDGKYQVEIYHPDFKKSSSVIQLSDGQTKVEDFTLENKNASIDDVDQKHIQSTIACCRKGASCKQGK